MSYPIGGLKQAVNPPCFFRPPTPTRTISSLRARSRSVILRLDRLGRLHLAVKRLFELIATRIRYEPPVRGEEDHRRDGAGVAPLHHLARRVEPDGERPILATPALKRQQPRRPSGREVVRRFCRTVVDESVPAID